MEKDKNLIPVRIGVASMCLAGLLLVFVFQHTDFTGVFQLDGGLRFKFFINRTVRFFLNDALTIALIWALFGKRQYVIFSLWVQLFGLFFLLIPYFVLKFYFPSYNGPLLSFVHRLILNPVLLLLLIPAFYYQGAKKK